jgi:hypothetical protein
LWSALPRAEGRRPSADMSVRCWKLRS